jgi:hypothetical protein
MFITDAYCRLESLERLSRRLFSGVYQFYTPRLLCRYMLLAVIITVLLIWLFILMPLSYSWRRYFLAIFAGDTKVKE